jgi:hypothetical protein
VTRPRKHSLRLFVLAMTMLLLVLSACVAAPGVARADDVRYSLGTIQEDRELTAQVGGSVATTLAFYNIDGNVPTIVSLSVAEMPPGWRVLLSRPGDSAPDSDTIALVVQPSLPGAATSGCGSPQRDSINLAPRGWVCADIVQVRVEVADSTVEGARGTVRIVASATWDTGDVATPFPQERQFLYDITVGTGMESVGAVDSSSPSLPASDSRIPLLLTGLVCAGGVLFLVRRALAKSGQLA